MVHDKGRKKGRETGGRKIITGGAKIVKMKRTQLKQGYFIKIKEGGGDSAS